jgi:hypothetical protein
MNLKKSNASYKKPKQPRSEDSRARIKNTPVGARTNGAKNRSASNETSVLHNNNLNTNNCSRCGNSVSHSYKIIPILIIMIGIFILSNWILYTYTSLNLASLWIFMKPLSALSIILAASMGALMAMDLEKPNKNKQLGISLLSTWLFFLMCFSTVSILLYNNYDLPIPIVEEEFLVFDYFPSIGIVISFFLMSITGLIYILNTALSNLIVKYTSLAIIIISLVLLAYQLNELLYIDFFYRKASILTIVCILLLGIFINKISRLKYFNSIKVDPEPIKKNKFIP